MKRAGVAVLLLSALLFGWNLWGYDLWAPDEPYFGEGAREMLVDGEWLVPHVEGVVTSDKPPLFFWLIAFSSLPFGGITAATARLPSALAAIASVALTMRLAKRLGSGERCAALAGVVLSTSVLFWQEARAAQIDSLLCFLILVALSAFADFRAGEAGGRRAGLLFWSAAALAVLAKGPVGLLLPAGVAVVTLAFDRNLGAWRRFAPLAGPLLFAGLTVPWAAAATLGSHGEYSVVAALRRHFVERAVEGMHHVQPPWYYLTTLPQGLLPWTGVLVGALLFAWRRRRLAGERFLLVFALFVVLVFTISTEKRDLYVLPAFPAFAILAARLIGATAGWLPEPGEQGASSPSRRWVTLSLGLVGGIYAAVGAVLPFVADRAGLALDLTVPTWVIGAVLVAGGSLVCIAALRGRGEAAVAATAAASALLYVTVAGLLLPAVNPVKSVRGLATEMASLTAKYRAAGGRVLAYGLGNESRALAFYSGGVYLEEMTDSAQLVERFESPQEVWLVAAAAHAGELPPGARRRLVEVSSSRMYKDEVVLLHAPGRP